ncbi:Rieske domain-containing protein [Sodiomyces alkalinus F11]|uniref:Rieske domain-containing protein n=1 Tax=Sodiomyces alkalinus (strain CBS 110278 / VKM F-3762 / F11) TaxID=1314773 RepID=A0A3N2PTD2_SODAK|nr:Rieske domain-containing protein [Sodiomyces alkalinus F11]ROT37779.1 Rieske domain-containing protein [Sodiomyces alkalinus F11]
MNPLTAPSRAEAEWFAVGLASSFPDLGSDDGNLAKPRICKGEATPGCKVFHVPRTDSSRGTQVPVAADSFETREGRRGGLKEQVLVFRYKGKFHAVDHQCPHSSFPLSQGIPFDIEDFGVVLSSGLMCPKHDWSFDLFTGTSDRGNYKLGVWEVQLREVGGEGRTISREEVDAGVETACTDKEVWVRRKQRIG